MKKLFYTCALLVSGFGAFAQNCLWHENFETVDSLTSDPAGQWTQTSQVFLSGSSSYFSPVTVTPNAAQTISFNTTGMTFVTLSFWHICRVDFLDAATLEYSVDGGANWLPIDDSNMDATSCSKGVFFGQGSVFTSASNLNWDPANPGTPANNTMWCKESFDISVVGGNTTAQVRWLLTDLDGNGANGYPGWYIEDVCINYAPCELNPPVHVNNLLSGTVYSLGPYTLSDSIFDASGIASANLVYVINPNTPPATPVVVAMTNIGQDFYQGVIPAVNDGDTVCYYFEATDASTCANYSRDPLLNCQQFIATTGIGFPFCDNFDSQNLWANTTVSGSSWDLGTPASSPPAPLSSPNSWEVALNASYLDNTETYLTITQPIDFGPALNGTVDFWFYSNAETGWDGARLEWKSGTSPTWQTLGDCNSTAPIAQNWYNDCDLNSSLDDAWTGTAQTWVNAKHNVAIMGGHPNVEFRFVFTSDASVTGEGFAVDDFCITVPPPEDAGISVVVSPNGQVPAGTCDPVTVTITNFGNQPLSSIPVSYINTVSGHTVNETWFGTLAPGTSVNYTFTACDTILSGAYCIQAYTSLPFDGNTANDSSLSCVFGIPSLSVTSCDDFETGSLGWVATGQWQLGTPNFGATTGAYSGTNAWDINLNGPYSTNSNDTLYTPFYIINGIVNPALRFFQNRNTLSGDAGFRIEFSENTGPWQTLGSTFSVPVDATNWYNQTNVNNSFLPGWDGNSNGWIKSTFSLASVLTGAATNVRFRFIFESGFNGGGDGVSIDDFCVISPPPIDAGVVTISQPTPQSPEGILVDVIVTIKNFGTTPLTTVPVEWASGASSGNGVYNGNLLPGLIATVTISTPQFTVPTGPFTLCAYTQVTGDGDNSNDTTCMDGIGIPVLTPTACLNFEANNASWIPSNGANASLWEWGTPAFGATTGAHSGVNAWDVSLNGPYTTNMDDTLYTNIYDVTTAVNPFLSFWHNRNTVSGDDGYYIEYNIDGGPIWQTLGIINDPNAQNWYNQVNLNFIGISAWDGNSNGWVRSTYNLNPIIAGFASFLRFRFIFHSDQFGNPTDGVSIDDFCIAIPPPLDAGAIVAQSLGGGALTAGLTDQVQINAKNFGNNALTTFGLTYAIKDINNTVIFTSSTVTWNGNLVNSQTTGLITHPDIYTVPGGEYSICAWTTLIGDGDASNDTVCGSAVGVPIIAIDYNNTYCDDFESGNVGWLKTLDPSGDPGSNWELGAPNFGATTGAYSGTKAWDVNLYSAYTANANCILTSPIFDFTNAVGTKMNFWRNHDVEDPYDGVRMEFKVGAGAWTVLGILGTVPPVALNWYNFNLLSSGLPGWSGASGGWQNSIWYNLNNYGGFTFDNAPIVQFRYIFTSDASVQQDGFSIDDFCLEVPVPLTTTPTNVGSTNVPAQLIFPGQCITFKGTIKNDGTTPINSTVATLTIDGNIFSVDTVNYATPLATGASQVYTFPNCWSATPGVHDICVITSLPNNGTDLKPVGDTVCYTIVVLDSVDVSQVTYCNDFDGSLPQWLTLNSLTYGPSSSWELGNPQKSSINTTHSGAKCWVTDLTQDYPNRDTSSLFTPVFKVVPGLPYKIQFWTNFETERNEDGGTVEYSTDYAATWTTLGSERDPNWMNTYNITALGSVPPLRPGWSGSSSGAWFDVNHGICFVDPGVNNVIFRYKFSSDFSIRYDGWAIDDFCFQLDLSGPLCTVGLTDVNDENGFSLEQNIPNPFNNQSVIKFNLTKPGLTQLTVTNVLGQVIAQPVNEKLLPGEHEVTIDANKLAPGIYYYTLNFNDKQLTKKMVITE